MRISDWSSDVCSSDLVALAEEGPAKAADQIDDGVEQRHRLPRRGQHRQRIEGPAEEGQRIDDEQRHHLQLLETLRPDADDEAERSEEHTSELQSLMRISYAVFCLKKKNNNQTINKTNDTNNKER